MNYKVSNEIQELKRDLESYAQSSEIKTVLILSTFKSELYSQFEKLDFINYPKPVVGLFFPKIFESDKLYETKTIAIGMNSELNIQHVNNLSTPQKDLEAEVKNFHINEKGIKTVFLFFDACATRNEELISHIFEFYGLECNYFGGACGDSDLNPKPCMFTNQGMLQDTCIVATLSAESAISVEHGQKAIAGPYLITKTAGKVIEEIEYRPALEVYKEILEKHSGQAITQNNFNDLSKYFSFGMPRLDSKHIIRDPIAYGPNNTIVTAGTIPENSFIYIMQGSNQSLLSAAQDATDKAKHVERLQMKLVMECLSRESVLGKEFSDELKVLSSNGQIPIGALALGEIANTGKEFLELYNKTIIICRM